MGARMDLTDPLVRDMADFNHRPEEHWWLNAYHRIDHDVRCGTCDQGWPCETRRELRRIKECEGQQP